ncbi:MAG: ABC transporter permease [Eubacteriales bacterium]|nr:ABC transporter permease [Eubacteriales bacterium]MDD3572951.1 ABC transporter permease [Eubacteriales bacterium]MDD4133685.1 ABC transporter permease [Eubacteriales bacterium]NLO12632.1 ABC transporter permease [Clostridiales bacterium]
MKQIRKGLSNASASVLAILAGLVAGLAILILSNPQNAFQGLLTIFKGGWNNGLKGVGQVMYHATPIIMTGLSVGFAFKTGMFNIGAAGQLMVGGFVAVYVGATWTFLPGALHWIVALVMGMLAGMAWGTIVGLFKALLNVNEVITSIMLNYIGMYLINFTIKNSHLYDPLKNQTVNVAANAIIPKGGLDNLFFILKGRFKDVSSVNAGFFIAVGFAILIYILLTRTTFGYELKACGHNRFASRYAGISEKRAIISAMAIAGGLSGVAGALMYLAPSSGMHIHVEEVLAAQGFNGIAVALLGLSNPIGIIFTGIFVAHLTEAGRHLQSLRYMKEIIDVIIGLIIYFSAFALLARDFLSGRKGKRAAVIADGQEAGREEVEA